MKIMDIKNANQLLLNRITAEQTESKQMVEGDLWLNGKGLIVKKPTNDKDTLAQMKNDFNSHNALAEVSGRRVDGVLGREPMFTITRRDGKELTPSETIRVDEMSAAITANWYNSELLLLLRGVYLNALTQVIDTIRPFVPSGYMDKYGNIIKDTSLTYAEALTKLYFERVSAANAGVFIYPDTQRPFSIYRYTEDGKTFVDFSFVDADGITQFKKFSEKEFDSFLEKELPITVALFQIKKEGVKTENENTINLGGKLFLYELDLRKPFITESMKQNQRGISLAKTMKGRNTYTAGFRERHFLGAEKPQKEIEVADPNNPGSKMKVFVPTAMSVGPGAATFTNASYIYDQDDKIVGRANASLVVVDPVSTTTFIEAKDEDYYSILSQASQTHVLSNEAAGLSGISRRESRSDHEKQLKGDKVQLDALGRYVVEFMMGFAAAVTRDEKLFEDFRCDFRCIVDAGLLTPEEKEDNRKAYAVGEISLETLMSRNGVEDTVAELSKIQAEDGYELNLLAKAGKAYADAQGEIPLEVFIDLLPMEDDKKSQVIRSLNPVNANGTKQLRD